MRWDTVRGTVSGILALSVVVGIALAASPQASIGFGAGVPLGLPVEWSGSRSFLAGELFLGPSISALLAIDTEPARFPDHFRLHLSLIPKGWIAGAALYAGGGASLALTRIADRWLLEPELHVLCGVQIWVAPPLTFYLQLRDVEPLPPDGVFAPDLSLGAAVAFSPPPRPSGCCDLEQIWILLGFSVAVFLLYWPRI
jgi:hypothetical protein